MVLASFWTLSLGLLCFHELLQRVHAVCSPGGFSLPFISRTLRCRVTIPISQIALEDLNGEPPALFYTWPAATNDTGPAFALVLPASGAGTSLWLALSFTSQAYSGRMVPADAVIGSIDGQNATVETYALVDRAPEAIVRNPFFTQSLVNATVARTAADTVILYFVRNESSATLQGPLYMNYAWNLYAAPGSPVSDFRQYHGHGRGSFILQPQALNGTTQGGNQSAATQRPSSSTTATTAANRGGPGLSFSGSAQPLDEDEGNADTGTPRVATAPSSPSSSTEVADLVVDPCDPDSRVTIAGLSFVCKSPVVRLPLSSTATAAGSVGAGGSQGSTAVPAAVTAATPSAQVLWTVATPNKTETGSGASNNTGTASFAIRLPTTGAWIAMAFPRAPAFMVPALAVVGRVLPGGEADCVVYRLLSYSLQGVQRTSDVALDACGLVQEGNTTTLYFTRPLSGRGWTAISADSPLHLNYAWGSQLTLSYHGGLQRGSFTIANLRTGAVDVVESIKTKNVARTHGILMTIAYSLLLPLGVSLAPYIERVHTSGPGTAVAGPIVPGPAASPAVPATLPATGSGAGRPPRSARGGRHRTSRRSASRFLRWLWPWTQGRSSTWQWLPRVALYAHMLINLSGVVLACTGLALATTGLKTPYRKTPHRHGSLGIACVVCTLFQALLGLIRPRVPTSRLWLGWSLVHAVLGTTVLALGTVNVSTGLHIIHDKYHVRTDVWIALAAGGLSTCFLLGQLVRWGQRVHLRALINHQRSELEDVRTKAFRMNEPPPVNAQKVEDEPTAAS